MPLGLHPDLKQRLVALVTECLPHFVVTNNSFLDYQRLPELGALDAALPDAKSDLRRRLHKLVGETPVKTFLLGTIADSLSSRPFDAEAMATSLSDIEDFADIAATAAQIVQAFDELPREYEVLVQLRYPASDLFKAVVGDSGVRLTSDLRLLKIPATDSPFALQESSDLTFLQSNYPSGVHAEALYVGVTVHGYIPRHGTTSALEYASFAVRSFLGLCMAQRILRRGYSASLGGRHRHYMFVYPSAVAGPARLEAAHELSFELSEMFDALALDSIYTKVEPADRPQLITSVLSDISVAMREHASDDRLLRAAQWLFDSNAGSSDLLSFVQAMICLEIALGDKQVSDLMGLGELLANRCAFLVGKTRKQRDDILVDFRRIYNTRSKIVHSGHNRLSAKEVDDLWTLRWLCSRVIQEEMRLSIADANARASAT